MPTALERLSARGRAFIASHVLKQQSATAVAPPPRPTAPVPQPPAPGAGPVAGTPPGLPIPAMAALDARSRASSQSRSDQAFDHAQGDESPEREDAEFAIDATASASESDASAAVSAAAPGGATNAGWSPLYVSAEDAPERKSERPSSAAYLDNLSPYYAAAGDGDWRPFPETTAGSEKIEFGSSSEEDSESDSDVELASPGGIASGAGVASGGAGKRRRFLSESSDSSSEEEALAAPKLPAGPRLPNGRVQWPQVDASPSATGMKTKATPAEYDGEHNMAGWRSSTNPENRKIATKLFTEDEQKQNELIQDETGRFSKGGAGDVAGDTLGYAMDATGRMVAFEENKREIVTTDMSTGEESRRPTWSASEAGAVASGAKIASNPQQTLRAENFHHSSALGGDAALDADGNPVLDDVTGKPIMRSRPVASAGSVTFDYRGRIIKITNSSGHYKPTVDYLAQAIEHLQIQGAFFDHELVDGDGDELLAGSNERKLYDAIKPTQEKAGNLAAAIATLTDELHDAETKQDEAAQQTIAERVKALTSELEQLTEKLDRAQTVLRKLGVGPSRRMRNVKAAYKDIRPGMTGLDVVTSGESRMDAVEFAKTGGGNVRQANRKEDVLAELIDKRAHEANIYNTADDQKRRELLAKVDAGEELNDDERTSLKRLDEKHARLRAFLDEEQRATERSKQAAAASAGSVPDIDAAMVSLGLDPN